MGNQTAFFWPSGRRLCDRGWRSREPLNLTKTELSMWFCSSHYAADVKTFSASSPKDACGRHMRLVKDLMMDQIEMVSTGTMWETCPSVRLLSLCHGGLTCPSEGVSTADVEGWSGRSGGCHILIFPQCHLSWISIFREHQCLWPATIVLWPKNGQNIFFLHHSLLEKVPLSTNWVIIL